VVHVLVSQDDRVYVAGVESDRGQAGGQVATLGDIEADEALDESALAVVAGPRVGVGPGGVAAGVDDEQPVGVLDRVRPDRHRVVEASVGQDRQEAQGCRGSFRQAAVVVAFLDGHGSGRDRVDDRRAAGDREGRRGDVRGHRDSRC
jgi:hypothetical protein